MPKPKSTGWKILLISLSVVVLAMVGFVVYGWWKERRAQFIRYEAFGIEIPVNYSVHGIDVSKYQDVIDWESVKEMKVDEIQISFAFIKATEGLRNEDIYFKRNWKRAKDAGLARGAYHFFLSTKSGKHQAESFIKRVKLEPGDMPPVLDVEQRYGVPAAKLRERVKEWLDTVEEYYGVKPIIYTNVDFYKQVLKDEFDDYPLWVAHYLQPHRPRIHRDWIFWQHSETGRVNGIRQAVDFNVFNGDSTAFAELLVK
jgi:lysozyme